MLEITSTVLAVARQNDHRSIAKEGEVFLHAAVASAAYERKKLERLRQQALRRLVAAHR